MSTVLWLENLKFQIWPKDHTPPHVHVATKNGEHEVKIDLATLKVISKKNPFSSRDLKRMTKFIEENRDVFNAKWEEFHGND